MTNQEKKKWLMQYRAAEREERRLSEELERWHSRAESTTARYGADTGGGGDGRGLEHAAEHIALLAAQLERQQVELVRLRRELGMAIDAVPDARHRELLRLRYIDGRTWEQIAEVMELSYQWICHLHGDALNGFRLVDPVDNS